MMHLCYGKKASCTGTAMPGTSLCNDCTHTHVATNTSASTSAKIATKPVMSNSAGVVYGTHERQNTDVAAWTIAYTNARKAVDTTERVMKMAAKSLPPITCKSCNNHVLFGTRCCGNYCLS